MCIFSTCGQFVYGLLMVACIALTATSTFTSSWSTTSENSHKGIMPWTCVTTRGSGNNCHNWWQSSEPWLRATAVMMCIALALEILALAWNLFTCFACCCKKWLIHPLSLFALLITAFLLASIITYGVGSKNLYKPLERDLGWSFWIAVGALICGAANVIVGCITVFLGKHHL